MKIYLIRHGHYLPDPEKLTEKGIGQVLRLSNRFKEEGVDLSAVYSSMLPRAIESASVFCDDYGIEGFVRSSDLDEDRPDETREETGERMHDFFKCIRHGDDLDIGVFSHFYSIRYFLNSVSGAPKGMSLPHAGVVLLDYSNDKFNVMPYSPNSHLVGIETR